MLLDRFKDELLESLKERGAVSVGVARPDAPSWRSHRLYEIGAAVDLSYLERTWFLRQDVRRLWPGVSSVVCVAFPYAVDSGHGPLVTGAGNGRVRPLGLVASYARGEDYHRALARRTWEAVQEAQARVGVRVRAHVAVDSRPVAERTLAASCGVGWVGRSSLLVVPGTGPRVWLAELALEVGLEPDGPSARGGCGTCRACVDACPTGALSGDGFRPDRCISYWTTQHRGLVPAELALRFGGRFFGCDECVAVCPVGRGGEVQGVGVGEAASGLVDLLEVLDLSGRALRRRFETTALSFLGPDQLRRNALVAVASHPELPLAEKLAILEGQMDSPRLVVRHQASLLVAGLRTGAGTQGG